MSVYKWLLFIFQHAVMTSSVRKDTSVYLAAVTHRKTALMKVGQARKKFSTETEIYFTRMLASA